METNRVPEYVTDLRIRYKADEEGAGWMNGKVTEVSVEGLRLSIPRTQELETIQTVGILPDPGLSPGKKLLLQFAVPAANHGADFDLLLGGIAKYKLSIHDGHHEYIIGFEDLEDDGKSLLVDLIASLLMEGKASSRSAVPSVQRKTAGIGME